MFKSQTSLSRFESSGAHMFGWFFQAFGYPIDAQPDSAKSQTLQKLLKRHLTAATCSHHRCRPLSPFSTRNLSHGSPTQAQAHHPHLGGERHRRRRRRRGAARAGGTGGAGKGSGGTGSCGQSCRTTSTFEGAKSCQPSLGLFRVCCFQPTF